MSPAELGGGGGSKRAISSLPLLCFPGSELSPLREGNFLSERGKTSVVVVPARAPKPEEGKLGKGATTT